MPYGAKRRVFKFQKLPSTTLGTIAVKPMRSYDPLVAK